MLTRTAKFVVLLIILAIMPALLPSTTPSTLRTKSIHVDEGDFISYTDFLKNTTLDNALDFYSDINSMNGCYIHIGKAAGSMIRCVLDLDVPSCLKGSARSKQYDTVRKASKLGQIFLHKPPPRAWCPFVIHMWDNYCDIELTGLLVVPTRNPISRIQSSFNYERCDLNNCMEAKQTIYGECFLEFEDLISRGLHDVYNSSSTIIPHQPAEMICAQRAWSFVSGDRQFWETNHHWYNYEFYFNAMVPYVKCLGITSSLVANPLLEPVDFAHRISSHLGGQANHTHTKCPRVMVIRGEHLAHDWDKIDAMLGGDGGGGMGSYIFDNARINTAGNVNGTNNKQALPKDGLGFLCRAMCLEFQYYKLTLWLSTNLIKKDIEESMEDLRHMCPDEPSVIRRCNTTAHPEPTIGQYKNDGRQNAGTGIGK
eukprot:CAMPEP_0201896686 /NCGR_PEP_ID=MMETSP0902-20130614/45121_1 /ASSEMBLY_ACC=CAM_ASM_000551 /TAXON_ID=420261 /ORGANISM="Thalassiosira antarctica, Strain CCMP982" /LENGTH=424 /DNA_ID=CAMNT_0048429343 /DNA_START=26 /DNA_END=1297 /DNA_ORIENTATION=-